MRQPPINFTWRREQGVMEVSPRYRKIADKAFRDGQEYPLTIAKGRSRASHDHYFAALSDGYDNLPEVVTPRFPSFEHLRKWLLVEAGYFDEKEVDCGSEDAAHAVAGFIRTQNEYARIFVRGSKVITRVAKSQDHNAMDSDEFEASKKAVLEKLEELIGLKPGELKKNAGRAA